MQVLLHLLFVSVLAIAASTALAQSDTVEHGSGQLSGRVVYGEAYLPQARVAVYHNKMLVRKMRADSNGSFTFTGLPAGWYRVKAVTRNNDVLISQNVLVKEQSDDSYVDEFSLLLKNLTFKRQQYADTPLRVPVDSILVRKARRELCVYHHHKLCKIYHISLGFEPEGAKHVQGDGRTPEGLYFINGKNPNSTYHKNLGISYPSPADIAYARKLGQPTGGDVKIHGLPAGEEAHRDDYVFDDWTWGCIALMNEEIDELCQFVPVGTPILIQP